MEGQSFSSLTAVLSRSPYITSVSMLVWLSPRACPNSCTNTFCTPCVFSPCTATVVLTLLIRGVSIMSSLVSPRREGKVSVNEILISGLLLKDVSFTP